MRSASEIEKQISLDVDDDSKRLQNLSNYIWSISRLRDRAKAKRYVNQILCQKQREQLSEISLLTEERNKDNQSQTTLVDED